LILILDTNKFLKEVKAEGPVKTPQLFMGKSTSPHPDGLFSEDFFGIDGSRDWEEKYSWIELNCPIIHPVLFDILYKRIEKKITPLLSGEKTYKFNTAGILEEDDDGNLTGMTSLYENRHLWRFNIEDDPDTTRNKIVSKILENIKTDKFFITKLIVVPPGIRPYSIMNETGEIMVDELNDIYQKIIMLSLQLKSVSGTLFDILAYKMQNHIKDLYEFVRNKTAKKEGMIRRLMLGTRVDFTARSVISPNPTLKPGQVGVPFRIVCQIFEPFILYGLVNSPYSKNIPEEFHKEVKKFLGKDLIIEDQQQDKLQM
jgi:DNA-directed RNA polymerase beta' subunit